MLKASNNFIQTLKKQKRENSSLLFLDNIKIIRDALTSGIKPLYILVDEKNLNTFEDVDCPIYSTQYKIIEQLTDSKTPQGVLCVMDYTQNVVEEPKTNFLVLDKLQDPGNVGTLIRTALACGFEYIYLLSSVKPTNSKVVRSSVGALFHTKVFSIEEEEFINLAKKWNLNLIAADMVGENIFDFHVDEKVGVVIGNEGQGISNEIIKICSKTVKIPMQAGIESLNASISGAIIMYQINKDKLI